MHYGFIYITATDNRDSNYYKKEFAVVRKTSTGRQIYVFDRDRKSKSSGYSLLRTFRQGYYGSKFDKFYQQNEMFKQGTHTCSDRIVSIFQPHIRPIVRGKTKTPTEFGSKIGVGVVAGGYAFVDHLSWDAYNEASDLRIQIELYKQRFGCLPTKIYADKIYMNRKNRQLMKDLEIEAMGKPLGRPPKNQEKEYEIQMTKSVSQRNAVEATFGTAKRIYRANNIRAKLPETANCWTGMCYFVKNIMKFFKELLYALFLWIKLSKMRHFFFCKDKDKVEIVLSVC